MPTGPALGVLELSSIARGIATCDALVKRAEVSVLLAGPTSPGKYVLVFSGGEAEVAESMAAAREVAADRALDALELPQPHPAILPALRGEPPYPGAPPDAVGVLELSTVAATLRSLDVALKVSDVQLVHLHAARGIDGKGYWVVTGDLPDVEAAIEHGDAACDPAHRVGREVIANPHRDAAATFADPPAIGLAGRR